MVRHDPFRLHHWSINIPAGGISSLAAGINGGDFSAPSSSRQKKEAQKEIT